MKLKRLIVTLAAAVMLSGAAIGCTEAGCSLRRSTLAGSLDNGFGQHLFNFSRLRYILARRY